MSGPKYSRAYIREMQRLKQLAKELEEQLENSKKTQVLSDIAKLEHIRQKYCSDRIVGECERIVPEAELLISDSKTLQKLKSTLTEIKQRKIESCNTSGNSVELLKRYHKLQGDMHKLKNSLLLLKDLKKQLAIEATDALQKKNAEEFFSMNWTDTGEKINTIPNGLQEIYYEVLEVLSETENYEQIKSLIDETIMKTGDTEYKKRQLELRMKAIEVENNRSHDNTRVLSLINELQGMYELLDWEEKDIPREQHSLEQKVAEVRLVLEQKNAAKYIANCVHQVFAEKGYVLLEDCVISNKSGQVQKDYFEFGEDALINVSMSEKGQMLFEVVGDGTEGGMDESRAAKLESEMRRFCPNYAEIKEILRVRYGISLEDEYVCEPDRKYAKAIDVATNKRGQRRKTEKKMMHYDD